MQQCIHSGSGDSWQVLKRDKVEWGWRYTEQRNYGNWCDTTRDLARQMWVCRIRCACILFYILSDPFATVCWLSKASDLHARMRTSGHLANVGRKIQPDINVLFEQRKREPTTSTFLPAKAWPVSHVVLFREVEQGVSKTVCSAFSQSMQSLANKGRWTTAPFSAYQERFMGDIHFLLATFFQVRQTSFFITFRTITSSSVIEEYTIARPACSLVFTAVFITVSIFSLLLHAIDVSQPSSSRRTLRKRTAAVCHFYPLCPSLRLSPHVDSFWYANQLYFMYVLLVHELYILL